MKTTDFLKENNFIGQDAHSMHQDHQHQMLREECYHIAVNAVALHKLLNKLEEGQPLDAWAAEYISLANDHIKSVKEFLEYQEMGSEDELPGFDAAIAESRFNESFADEILALAKKQSPNARMRPDVATQKAELAALQAKRAAEPAAPGKSIGDEERQQLTAKLAQLRREFDPHYARSEDSRVFDRNERIHRQIKDIEYRLKQGVAEGSENLSIGQQMAKDGITYSPEKEKELIGLMAQYMKKSGMSSRAIRYHLNYDEDFIPDQLSELPRQGVTEGYILKKTNVNKYVNPGDPNDYTDDTKVKNTDYEIISNKTGHVVGTASWTTNDYFGPGALKITMKNGATRYLDIWNSEKGNPQSAFNRFVKDTKTAKKYKEQGMAEAWSQKYKNSINCSHPKGFSQKAHCAGKKKHNEDITMEMVCPDCGMCRTHGNLNEIKKGQKDTNGYTRCWPGKHAEGTKKGKNGGQVRNCVPNEDMSESIDYDDLEDRALYVINTETGKVVDGPFDTTGEIPLRLMGYDGAHKVIRGRELKTKQQARNAFGGMFGTNGDSPAAGLSIRKKGAAEGRKLRENATAGATGSPSVAVSMAQEGNYPGEMIARQKNYTNQRTKGGPVKIKAGK